MEIKSPANGYFERAVLYLRAGRPPIGGREAKRLAEDYVAQLEPRESGEHRSMRLAVTVLSMSLALSLTALAAVLVIFGARA